MNTLVSSDWYLNQAQETVKAKDSSRALTATAAEDAEVQALVAIEEVKKAQATLAAAAKEEAEAQELAELYETILADKSKAENELSLASVTRTIGVDKYFCQKFSA